MIVSAIYARKSTEQNGVSDEERSVTRQIEHAKAYAARKGWAVADHHVYVDDGISGAEFSKRPGFLRLMNALKPRPAFQALIMSEESRLGREQIEVAYALKQLAQAGVHVWSYLEDRERTLESPTDKLLLSVTAFADELEREKARARTHDAMIRKARQGHVTGGRVFGYDNVPVLSPDGAGHRLHVTRRINDAEAAIVRQIFQLYADGLGLRSIAIKLNDEGAPAPMPRRIGRPRGWAPSSVREILRRELYRGRVVWNQTKKRNQWGVKSQQKRPHDDWIIQESPALCIVSGDLWRAAHERLGHARQAYLRGTDGKLWGRPPNGVESKYLLTGFSVCGLCGGSLHVRSRSHGRLRAYFYGCTSYHLRGRSVCDNRAELHMEETDAEVLQAFEIELLHPDAITRGIAMASAELADAGRPADRRAAVADELHDVEAQLARLEEAIRLGGSLPTLIGGMQRLEERRLRLRHENNCAKLVIGDLRRLETELRGMIDEWTAMLRRNTAQARQMLRQLLVNRIVFTPTFSEVSAPVDVAMEAEGSLVKLFRWLPVPKAMVAPTGFEPVFQP